MLYFIKKISLFLIIPFLFWGGSYWHFQQNKTTIYQQLYSTDLAIQEAPDTFPLLVAGHSRLFQGIDTSLLKDAIKIGTPGESFIESYYKLKYIFETENKHPQTVLLPFEMGTFKANDFRRSFYWKKYVDFLAVGKQKKDRTFYFKEYMLATIFPFRQYFSQQVRACFQNKSKKVPDKTARRFSDYPPEERREIIQKDIDLLKREGLMDRIGKYFVEKTIELCQQHHVKLIYITCPLTKEYTTALAQVATDQNYMQEQQQLINLIDQYENVSLIDLQRDFDNKDDYFFDHHHLNKEGSRVFTEILIKKQKIL